MINDPHLVVLFDVSGDVDESARRSYSRRFFAGMRTLGAELPDDLDNLPHVKLSLVNRQAALAALPADIVAQLMTSAERTADSRSSTTFALKPRCSSLATVAVAFVLSRPQTLMDA